MVAVILGWLGFGLPFLARKRQKPADAARKYSISNLYIAIQGLGVGLAFMLRREPGTPLIADHAYLQLPLLLLIILFSVLASWLVKSSIEELGKQWSLTARVISDHSLIRTGPYSLVRHPIYTALLLIIAASALAFCTWSGVIASIAIYLVGTVLRYRVEERLLIEIFGAQYTQYRKTVPAIIPYLWKRQWN